MKKASFPAHGKVDISVDGQILIINGSGPANLEMIEQYQKGVVGFREKIMHAPWASLVLLSGTPLVTAEAKGILTETIKQAKLMHLAATAVVFVDIEFSDMIRHFWQEIYQDTDVKYHFFDTETEARQWLESILKLEAKKHSLKA